MCTLCEQDRAKPVLLIPDRKWESIHWHQMLIIVTIVVVTQQRSIAYAYQTFILVGHYYCLKPCFPPFNKHLSGSSPVPGQNDSVCTSIESPTGWKYCHADTTFSTCTTSSKPTQSSTHCLNCSKQDSPLTLWYIQWQTLYHTLSMEPTQLLSSSG